MPQRRIFVEACIYTVIGCLGFIAVGFVFRQFDMFNFKARTTSEIVTEGVAVALILFVLRYFYFNSRCKAVKR